jgi:hypothetical protein
VVSDKWFSIQWASTIYLTNRRIRTENVSNPYHYTRFRWMKPLDLEAASKQLATNFDVLEKSKPRDDVEISLYADQRNEIVVRADTLAAMINPVRAVLYQRERSPFTVRDQGLRAWVFENFDKTTPTPFPWGGAGSEPHYEVDDY